MKDSEIASDAKNNKSLPDSASGGNFQKVLDGRNHPIRGLWQRNKRFYARFSVEDPSNGRKEVRRVPLKDVETVAEARKALNKLLTRREDSDLPSLKRAPKFEDYEKTYLAYLTVVVDAKRPATVQKERYILQRWREHLGAIRLNNINRAMINAFIAKRQAAGISGRTVNLDVIVLRNVLRRAIDDGWIKTMPTDNLRPLKWIAKKRGLVSADEIKQLCAGASQATKNSQQFADYVKLMAYSGARRNEALRLTWADVDWGQRQLTVGSDGLAKNREHRVIDFNADLEAHLIEMKSRCAPDSRFLFPSPQRGVRDVPAKSFIDSLKLTREATGLKINFHDCRHFFISMAVMSGIDFMTIARWVGHKDGGVLIGKVYGHLSNEHAQRQAQRLVFAPRSLEAFSVSVPERYC
jgi:integrase